ncbi:MAG: hypothetical protein LBH45_03010 [Campylobacteraceae bacterium]|jgi:uncharacterized lipoprotein YehR (DUF1307 family)|nr:hypothetical protein [Campylobacteraceae bacterium]
MIVIQKKYLFLVGFCILTIVLIFFLRVVPYRHIYLNSKQIEEFHYLASQGNATAMSKLISYYYLINKDMNKTIEVFKQYKDVSINFKKGYYRFLTERTSDYKNEMIPLAIELANEGDYYMQRELADFYANGIYVEKDLQKAAYWKKISECNRRGISMRDCEMDKKLRQ